MEIVRVRNMQNLRNTHGEIKQVSRKMNNTSQGDNNLKRQVYKTAGVSSEEKLVRKPRT